MELKVWHNGTLKTVDQMHAEVKTICCNASLSNTLHPYCLDCGADYGLLIQEQMKTRGSKAIEYAALLEKLSTGPVSDPRK